MALWLAGKTRDSAKKAAEDAFALAVENAQKVERGCLGAELQIPSAPKIEIKDDSITLSVGLSQITIKADGIVLQTKPTSAVTINGNPHAYQLAPGFEVGE